MKNEIIRARIVAAARLQIKVPYHKDTHLPGVGLDCVGLVGHALEQGTGLYLLGNNLHYGPISAFRDHRIPKYLESQDCHPIHWEKAEPGDILIFTYGTDANGNGVPMHSGLVTVGSDVLHKFRFIHSSACYGKVAEHALQGEWSPGRRLFNVYSIADVLAKL